MRDSGDAELLAVLKEVHFELQEFFRCSDAMQGGGFRHIERARTIAAEAIDKTVPRELQQEAERRSPGYS